MILIPPAELSGKVMTLIDQCRGRMVIISPYMQLRHWRKLAYRITTSQQRGVSYDCYYRSDQDYADELSRLNISGIPVHKLHAKIYYNQEQALVTSMNLYHYSDTFSIDIGYLTETPEEYAEIVKFVDCYIKPAIVSPRNTSSHRGANAGGQVSTNRPLALQSKALPMLGGGQSLPSSSHLIHQAVSEYVERLVIGGVVCRDQVSQRGNTTTVSNYCEGVDLIVDIRRSYDRLLLRATGENYRAKRQRYQLLRSNLGALERVIGASLARGDEMKRLKWEVVTTNRSVSNGRLNPDYIRTLTEHLDRAFGPLRGTLQKLPQAQDHTPSGTRMLPL